jgi:hypothetical protein
VFESVLNAVGDTVGNALCVGSVCPDQNPDAAPVRPVTPEVQAAVQQLLQRPQGGVKGGQVDPIYRSVDSYESPDAPVKRAPTADQIRTVQTMRGPVQKPWVDPVDGMGQTFTAPTGVNVRSGTGACVQRPGSPVQCR